jgi:hypothetical protein
VGKPWEVPAIFRSHGGTAELVKICGVANEDEPPTKLMRELRDIRGLQFPCPSLISSLEKVDVICAGFG